MKFRAGFVSNSSSSSFTLVCHGELTEEMLNKALAVPEGHPLRAISRDIVLCILKRSHVVGQEEIEEEIEYYGDNGGIKTLEAIKNGCTIYRGSFGDDTYDVETMLCFCGLNFETEEIKFECEGGY